jgi:pSer/pThr/pTyr-binding forkhead associated (FHA) protein
MALRFRILPADDTRPAGRAAATGPLVARDVELPGDLAEIRIGRHADVELPLPFALLSGVHARLSRASSSGDTGWLVEDMRSTNGTWLDGARLAPGERRPFAAGAELRLATVRLRFEGVGPTLPAAEGTGTIARRLVDDLFGGSGADAPTLRVVRGAPSASLSLTMLGRTYVAGRAEGCALCLPVEEVSREHAAFVRAADGVVVRDLGSKNGVVVAGARIAGERALIDGDAVQIGPVLLTLDDPVARYLRELDAMAPELAAPPTLVAAPPPLLAAPATLVAAPAPVPPILVVPAEPLAPFGRARSKIGATQLVVAVAVSALLLLAAAAGVLVFGRG